MKKFVMCQFVHHETLVCHEPSELESSTSLPGGNLVDGLPPVVNSCCGLGRHDVKFEMASLGQAEIHGNLQSELRYFRRR